MLLTKEQLFKYLGLPALLAAVAFATFNGVFF